MQEIFLKFAISILFSGLRFVPFELPNAGIGQESGVNLYKKLTDPHADHQLSLSIRQKFLRLAHCRFFLSKILGNYQVGTRALTHHMPTMQTIYVLQHVSINFFKPIEPNYPFESGHPPICMNKCCQILAIVDRILIRNPDFGNLKPIDMLDMLRLVQSCAFANIGMRIESDAAFGLDSSYLGSKTFWRELTPQMFWAWANQDGLLKRMILRFISHKNRS
jgi:hypothetical protein